MKNRSLISILSFSLIIGLFTGCGSGYGVYAPTASAPLELQIGVSTGENDPRNIAAHQFADEVAEKTNGAITAKIHPSGELGGDAALIDELAMNSSKINIIITDASNFATYEPKMGISALPFMFDDFESAWAFMDSDIEAQAEELLIKDNIRVLAHYCNGFRCMTNSIKPINSPADMEGMLIRTPENPVIMATMSSLNATPMPLSFSELYDALEAGRYDGQENPIPVIYNNNLYEVQQYLSVTNHIYSGMCFAISDSLWNSLSLEQQKIIREAAISSAEADRQMNKAQSETLLSELEKKGMIINEPDLEPFKEATRSVITDNASIYGDLYDELLAYLNKSSK